MVLIYLVGARLARWLFKYVFTAGNTLATIMALILPYLTRFHILPYMYHPYRYGGIPFTPPSFFEFQSMYYIIIFGVLIFFYLISGFMSIYKICNKPPAESYDVILYNVIKFLLTLFVCLFILFFLPLLKFPFLTAFVILPYANEIVNGIFWAFFTLVGTTWANIDNVTRVCCVSPFLDW